MATKHTIPRSQAIYPYGVGAILDWGQECFVVLDTRTPGWRSAPKTLLPRLQNRLGVPGGFRLPPVDTDWRHPKPLEVQRFPSWLFCPRCRRMSRWGRHEETVSKDDIPRCSAPRCGKAVLVPMRYVAVCEDGHLTDVDWHRWAHSASGAGDAHCERGAATLYFDSRADQGATLEALSIRCSTCNSSRTLKDVLNLNSLSSIGQRCPGRQPWQRRDGATPCAMQLRVLQRSQTAVHYADIVSALDIATPAGDKPSAFDVTLRQIVDSLGLVDFAEAESLANTMAAAATRRLGTEVTQQEVRDWLTRHFDVAATTAIGTDPFDQASEAAMLMEEWPALTTPTESTDARAALVVRRDTDTSHTSAALQGLIEDIFLVERLKEIRAFRGFRRVRPDATLVPPDLGVLPRENWLPAIEVFGEGIFLQFSMDAIRQWETEQAQAIEDRLRRIRSRLATGEGPVKRFRHLAALAPRFVMIHTFSHLLMRQLCYESGYGGAAVRERLYVFDDRVGLLVYTAAGDSEGSLGGLVRQGRNDRLGRTIASALERASWCSNDPICREIPEHGFEKLDLAACHACALAPETSCSHLNALLDRELVIGEGRMKGFFASYLDTARHDGQR